MTGGLRQFWLRGGLVVAEVALSLMLLAGASLMVRTVLAMGNAKLGIRTDRLLTMRIPLNPQRYPDSSKRGLFFQELLDRVAAVPGVNAVGVNTGMHPLGNWNFPVEVPGAVKEDQRRVLVHQVNEDYIRAYGIPLLHGRMFTRSEVSGKQHLALVNQAFVRRHLSAMEPLGRIFRVPRLRGSPFELKDDTFQIVGVVQDTVNRVLADEILPEVYLPFTITGLADQLIVMAGTDPAAVADTVRRQVYSVDPEQPVTNVRTVDSIINQYVLAEPRFNLVLFAVFAGSRIGSGDRGRVRRYFPFSLAADTRDWHSHRSGGELWGYR